MINFEVIPGVIRVPLADPFDKFYVLVVPAPEIGENYRQFYLMCQNFGVVVDMFACAVNDDQNAAEIAWSNGPEYIEPDQYK